MINFVPLCDYNPKKQKMKTRSKTFLIENELPWEPAGEGAKRQILGYDGQITMVKVSFEKGAVGALHEHYHTQVSYVASGRFEVTSNGETRVLGPGDGFYVEPDSTHGVVCLEAGTLLDVFTPQRSDFLKK